MPAGRHVAAAGPINTALPELPAAGIQDTSSSTDTMATIPFEDVYQMLIAGCRLEGRNGM